MTDPTGAQAGIVVIKLEGRGPLNLLGEKTFQTLKAELDRLEQDRSVRAIILTGSGGRAFSAGVDLHQMKDLNSVEAESFIRALHGPARKLLTMAVPVIRPSACYYEQLHFSFLLVFVCGVFFLGGAPAPVSYGRYYTSKKNSRRVSNETGRRPND